MVSIIGSREYEKGKKLGTQLRALVEKEIDRAKKKIADERREFITRHERKCRICESKVKLKAKSEGKRPILDYTEDTLYCQDCYRSLMFIDWDLDVAEKMVDYLKERSGD